jgi:choline dehydrogenase-like flavoprotein
MSGGHVPPDPGATQWDAIVIGTGMGGGTAGYELARLGRRVLFVEKGWSAPGGKSFGGEAAAGAPDDGEDEDSPRARLRAGRWPLRLQEGSGARKTEFFAPLGCGIGGSTALYAAALERFQPSDFAPRANFPDVPDATLPERWPITYEELRPFYEQAERMFGVAGTPDPLDRGSPSILREPPPLSPRDGHLESSFRELGLHPYRVHVACDFVAGCTGCGAGPCARGCKRDAATVCVLPALEQFGARLLPGCEVLSIEADASSVREVRCRWRGRDLALRAKVVVLAAGAYMTPALLLKSRSAHWPDGLANRSGQVGRNLMMHVSDFFAVAPRERLAAQPGPYKSLALNDFYAAGGEKLGTF